VCPDSPVNARATITLNACPVPQQRLGPRPPHLVLEALRRLLEAALALDAFRTRVSTCVYEFNVRRYLLEQS